MLALFTAAARETMKYADAARADPEEPMPIEVEEGAYIKDGMLSLVIDTASFEMADAFMFAGKSKIALIRKGHEPAPEEIRNAPFLDLSDREYTVSDPQHSQIYRVNAPARPEDNNLLSAPVIVVTRPPLQKIEMPKAVLATALTVENTIRAMRSNPWFR